MLFDDAVRSGKLSQGDLSVVAFVKAHPQEVMGMTSQELGAAAFVSASTVVRLCKKAGFTSFADMKVRLARELADEQNFRRVDSDFPELANASFEQVTSTISSMEREAMRKTERLLARVNWRPLLDAMDSASSVSIIATGFSCTASQTFAANLERIGKRVTVCGEVYSAQHWLGVCPRDEFVIIVSYSGEGAQAEGPAKVLNKRGMRFLAVTSNADTPLSRLTTWRIPLAVTERRLMNTRVAPFQSTSSEAYALDVLFAQLYARSYTKNMQLIQRAIELQGIRVTVDESGVVRLEDIGPQKRS